MAVKKGDYVKVTYKLTLDDGTVFDCMKEYNEPYEFEVGAGQMITGLENSLIGMEVGEEKKVTLQPAQAFGQLKPELIRKVERKLFPNETNLQLGMVFKIDFECGVEMLGEVVGIADEMVIIDLNHPLAGKTLNYEIKVLSISS